MRYFSSKYIKSKFVPAPGAGLVGWWEFDEESGTGVADSSGNDRHGTTVGSPGFVPGHKGNAISLNGTSQYVNIPHHTSLNIPSAITLAAWVRPDLVATQNIIRKASHNVTDGYDLCLASTGFPFFRINQFTNGNDNRVDANTPYPTAGTWMHIVGTFNGFNQARIYIDGELDGIETFSSTPIFTNILPVRIGADASEVNLFSGRIDDVRIYNRELNPEEILNVYEGNDLEQKFYSSFVLGE